MRVLLVMLMTMVVIVIPCHAKLEEGQEVNILEVMQKIPLIAPLLKSRVGGACSSKINAFSTEITVGVEKLKGSKQSYMPVVKKAWCLLGRKCTEELVESSMSLISGGGFLEQMIKTQLPPGLDLSTLDKVIMAYFEDYCEKVGQGDVDSGIREREEI